MENIDLSVNDKDVSNIIRNLGFEGNIEILLNLYKKEKIHQVLKEEIELALFNSVTSCVRKLEFDKLELLILNPEINDNLRLHAKITYENGKRFDNKSKCSNCKDCKCVKEKEKLKNTGN